MAPHFETIDDKYNKVAQRVPTFAGVWFEPGRWVIAVTDGRLESAKAAQTQLRKIAIRDIGHLEPRVVQAKYSFAQLWSWYQPTRGEILGMPGAVSSDIDEKENRLVFGFENLTASRKCVEAVLDRSEVPPDAYSIEQQSPLRLR